MIKKTPVPLHRYLEVSVKHFPDRIAVAGPGAGTITYSALDALADRLRDRLAAMGVGRGNRVGICLRKSIDSVAAIFGILKTGAAYVPVDPDAPAVRNAYILDDCAVSLVVAERGLAGPLREELASLNGTPPIILLDHSGDGEGLRTALACAGTMPAATTAHAGPDELACILYTSGSTGSPKGVMLTHGSMSVFVDWCSTQFQPSSDDRFSSHAPFHFDLSILDVYVPLKHGATVVLVSEAIGKQPSALAELIADARITCWYSTPSVLSLLAQYGKLDMYDFNALRLVNFAGEVFPLKHLRLLKSQLPHAVCYNLYGPTETNVCTHYRIPDKIAPDRAAPYPIGKPCLHYEGYIRIMDQGNREVLPGEEGELYAGGPGVMKGYWGLPEQTAAAFWIDEEGKKWHRTGDIVRLDEHGDYVFVGRSDRMVKRRGYRIELGEIETVLYRHPEITEAAVIAIADDETGMRIKAFVACRPGCRPSVVALKGFCVEHLPAYMVPDLFSFHGRLQKTSTDKIDYQKLEQTN